MNIPPIAQQLFVAGSTLSAAFTAGGIVAYPGVLLQHFKANDTIIQLDLDNGSWIGSVHGLAGIPSFLMPLIMQVRGRKFAFILSCILIIIGWGFTYAAQSIYTLIVGECFHGLGGHSLLIISILSVSEMLQPQHRNICLLLYGMFQALGMSLVGILGRYLHWKTAGLIMCSPIVLSLIVSFTWPESPSWLAFRGRYEDCENTFKKLRGTSEEAMKELNALVIAQKELLLNKPAKRQWCRDFNTTIRSKNFYVPCLHACILISVYYWAGGVVVLIYSSDITLYSTGNKNEHIKFILDITYFVGYIITSVLSRYFGNKKVLLFSMFGAAVFMTSAAVLTYLQSIDMVAKDLMFGVYLIVGFMVLFSLGSNGLGFAIASELIPVKYRGMGGCWYVICTCIFHSSSLKSFPYLCVFINMWGAFLIYGIYTFLAALIILIYIPETKYRTLQEIEEYYNLGYFKKSRDVDDKDEVRQKFLKNEVNQLIM